MAQVPLPHNQNIAISGLDLMGKSTWLNVAGDQVTFSEAPIAPAKARIWKIEPSEEFCRVQLVMPDGKNRYVGCSEVKEEANLTLVMDREKAIGWDVIYTIDRRIVLMLRQRNENRVGGSPKYCLGKDARLSIKPITLTWQEVER